jgi:hypothetical protein
LVLFTSCATFFPAKYFTPDEAQQMKKVAVVTFFPNVVTIVKSPFERDEYFEMSEGNLWEHANNEISKILKNQLPNVEFEMINGDRSPSSKEIMKDYSERLSKKGFDHILYCFSFSRIVGHVPGFSLIGKDLEDDITATFKFRATLYNIKTNELIVWKDSFEHSHKVETFKFPKNMSDSKRMVLLSKKMKSVIDANVVKTFSRMLKQKL